MVARVPVHLAQTLQQHDHTPPPGYGIAWPPLAFPASVDAQSYRARAGLAPALERRVAPDLSHTLQPCLK